MNLTKEQLGYIAGVIDGEGSISIIKASNPYKPQYQLRLIVTNTDYRMLKWLKDTIGCGNVLERKRIISKPNWSNVYIYSITAMNAKNLLQEIYPYLVIKKEQADIAIEFCKTMLRQKNNIYGCKGLTQDILDKREQLKQSINYLNRRSKFSSLKNNDCEFGGRLTANTEPSRVLKDLGVCRDYGQSSKEMI